MIEHPLLNIHSEVLSAIENGHPVVALESTIISHSMPWPQNVDTALSLEKIVRENGAIPATIAILDGQCQIGLTTEQIHTLGTVKDVWKVSLRDMPFVISQRIPGATTVAATMRIASMAGIKIFATGGIGGVHRGAEHSMDISTDLTEMSHTSVAVISAGVKSILDIGLTLEYLETMGIPVVTWGQDAFPSFYSRESNFPSPLRLNNANAIAALLHAKWRLGLNGSVLIANPVPSDWEIPAETMEAHILDAIKAADLNRISGKELTPYLLKYISEHTRGESLEANIALIRHNAKAGAALAVAFQCLSRNTSF
jgi:pseudouridine-5'-phosphate glycosidase